jgi:hypothetical protein
VTKDAPELGLPEVRTALEMAAGGGQEMILQLVAMLVNVPFAEHVRVKETGPPTAPVVE